MAILETNFYHKTISMYTAAFGTLFNNIRVSRDSGLIKVPIAYQSKQKDRVRTTQNPDPNQIRVKSQLPRLSFKLVALNKDLSRITNRFNRLCADVDRTQVTSIASQYNRIPYSFSFELGIKTKYMDDMLEIIEQILVYFNPAVTINITDNPDLALDSAIDVYLEGNSLSDVFEGAFEDEKILESVMSFRLDGWLYMPTSNANIIRTIDINYKDLINSDLLYDTDHITS